MNLIQNTRKQKLNTYSPNLDGEYVIYWMQSSQRASYNHALEFAIEEANELQKPLIVFFGLTDSFPEANERHFYFMVEGLKGVKQQLYTKGINFVIRKTSPELGIAKLAKEAASVIVDRGYLRIEKKWRRFALGKLECPLIQIESNVIVPIEETSDKEEYAAATIRPKITRKLDEYLVTLKERVLKKHSLEFDIESLDIANIEQVISKLATDHSVKKSDQYRGGLTECKKNLELFIEKKLWNYDKGRNDPVKDYISHLSPYLHYGQVSPLFIALEIQKTTNVEAKKAFLEQLIVRRELSSNFVFYNNDYDNYNAILPNWTKSTLEDHIKDSREYIYTQDEFELEKTHDPFWNAAQKEMVITGKMHNYMRMYWGKKILEWTKTPEEAYNIAIYLNNKYELDGRDPNGYTGVAWIFGKHDRPWKERPIFGKIRYMNANGLRRKFDAEGYVKKVENLEHQKD
ncbi:MAG TPA: deoxyribodipyrimidine photo-lyase [candidate division Zixibacteria bacterium]|nr:deoxyribodipyrimidine photo-lyase [candidate division Zixibacteria bacterium]